MVCPRCGGYVSREPAALSCFLCGARVEIIDADESARLAQRLRDLALRPRSIETWPEHQDLVSQPWRPTRGWVKLPGSGLENRRPARRRGPSPGERSPKGLDEGVSADEGL